MVFFPLAEKQKNVIEILSEMVESVCFELNESNTQKIGFLQFDRRESVFFSVCILVHHEICE